MKNKITLCFNIKDLIINYNNKTQVIAQWAGRWKSDFFYFKVNDLKKFIKKHPKKDYQIL